MKSKFIPSSFLVKKDISWFELFKSFCKHKFSFLFSQKNNPCYFNLSWQPFNLFGSPTSYLKNVMAPLPPSTYLQSVLQVWSIRSESLPALGAVRKFICKVSAGTSSHKTFKGKGNHFYQQFPSPTSNNPSLGRYSYSTHVEKGNLPKSDCHLQAIGLRPSNLALLLHHVFRYTLQLSE